MYDEYISNLGYMNYPYTTYSKSIYNNSYINRASSAAEVSKEVLESIKKSVESEREDELFYDHLIQMATDQEDKKIIESIRNDERHHNVLLRKIYLELTGVALPKSVDGTETELNFTYLEGLEKALMGELAAISKYRKILSEMSDKKRYNMLMEIMTDEIRHASKYNFLITKNMFENSKKGL